MLIIPKAGKAHNNQAKSQKHQVRNGTRLKRSSWRKKRTKNEDLICISFNHAQISNIAGEALYL